MSPAASKNMEENKHKVTTTSHSNGDGVETVKGYSDAVEIRFSDFVKSGLALDENTSTQAVKLFKETKHLLMTNVSSIGNGTSEEAERFWFAFVSYSGKRLSKKNRDDAQQKSDDTGLTLCQILRLAKLNIVDFFKELPHFIVKAGPILSNIYGTDWENRLEAKELQANFVHLSILSRHYKRSFRELFLTSDANAEKQLPIFNDITDYHRFGWLLFLALRVHAFSRFKDLVTCTNGLVSVLAVLIIHVPVRFRNFSFNDSPWFVRKGDKGVDLLASLCNKYDTSEEVLRKSMETTNSLIANILMKKPHLASEYKNENLVNINPDGLIYYEDLMEESSLKSSLNILEKDYDDAICNKAELDERVFINEEDSLLGSASVSGGSLNVTGAKRKFDLISSPTRTITSPLSAHRSPASHTIGILGSGNSNMVATPVSTAMTTAKWLRAVISPLPSKPSAQLEHFLVSCDRDVTNDVTRRAQIILEAIFPSSALGERCVTGSLQSTNLMDNIWAEQRRLEALKLYYRVLESMCTAEAQILHATNLTSLLTNERFHRCMLACSAELVVATYKTVTMLFPAVLERTGITAFDLSKVIESFIRHEESLPRELRRHLNSLEERLLDSMVWEKGSSLYNSLTVARPALSAEINRLGLLAEPMPSLDAIAMHINFSSGCLPPVPSLQKLETSPGTGQNGDLRSPKRPCTEFRSVLVERNSFTSPVKDRLLGNRNSFTSPAKDRLLGNLKSKLPPPPLQSAFASPTRPNPGGGGETCAETGINVFFTKAKCISGLTTVISGCQPFPLLRRVLIAVYSWIVRPWLLLRTELSGIVKFHSGALKINKLAAVRISGMIEKLQPSQQHIRENVYRLFQLILSHQTSLFFNRHIDQIILCCFYGVAKISKLNLTFKEIIHNYRRQSHCKTLVFRSVFVDWSSTNHNGRTGQDHVDIITFYNDFFIPAAKPLLVEVGSAGTTMKANHVPEVNNNKDGQCPASPKVSPFPSLPDMSPKKVSSAHNVYVSPLRSSKMDALISNSSKSYYACVGESTHAYQSPSKDLNTINNRLNGTRKARGTLNLDNDVGLVSDSMVAKSLCLQNGSSASTSGANLISEQPDS